MPPEADTEPLDSSSPPAGLGADVARLGQALQGLLAAHGRLLQAELGLARGAVISLLLTAGIALVLLFGCLLTVLALAAVLLAHWFGSWPLALLVLGVLQLGVLLWLAWWMRRCLHWISLPASRAQWRALWTTAKPSADAEDAS